MDDRELTIKINTNVKYQKIIIKNICNLHTVKETPKVIKTERIMDFPTSEMIQESISRMQETMEALNKSIMSSISDLAVYGENIIGSIGENTYNLLDEIIGQISAYKIPKIHINKSQEIKDKEKFLNIAEENVLPIFLEIDTPLQENVLKIAESSSKDKLKSNLEDFIMNYYDNEQIDNILDFWMEQNWLENERKGILKEAVEVYKLEYYAASTSTLMCQIGGVITCLYKLFNLDKATEKKEKKKIENRYRKKKKRRDNFEKNKYISEKMKALIMTDIQSSGLLIWYRCANYLNDFVYSSEKSMAHFKRDPGRHKICHGVQYNYQNKLFALKAILAMDMIIQLSDELINFYPSIRKTY